MGMIALLAILAAGMLLYGIFLLLKHEEEFGAGCPVCHTRYIGRVPEGGWYCRLCGASWANDIEWVRLHQEKVKGDKNAAD